MHEQYAYYWRIVSFFGIRENSHAAVMETCDSCHAHSGKARGCGAIHRPDVSLEMNQ
jgi:hypothetical protein